MDMNQWCSEKIGGLGQKTQLSIYWKSLLLQIQKAQVKTILSYLQNRPEHLAFIFACLDPSSYNLTLDTSSFLPNIQGNIR